MASKEKAREPSKWSKMKEADQLLELPWCGFGGFGVIRDEKRWCNLYKEGEEVLVNLEGWIYTATILGPSKGYTWLPKDLHNWVLSGGYEWIIKLDDDSFSIWEPRATAIRGQAFRFIHVAGAQIAPRFA